VRGQRWLVLVVIVGSVVSAIGCSGQGRSSQSRLVTTVDTTASPCGIGVGYLPRGLKMLNVEGGPERNNVDIRFVSSASTSADRRWVLVGAVWGQVVSMRELRAAYPSARRAVVRGHEAVLARPGSGAVLLQWNQSTNVSVSVEGRGGVTAAEVRRIADHLDVPATRPTDLPGPPEASPEGCSLRR
jgi:hypothetical protein